MNNKYTAKEVMCPFYKWQESGKIHCEGVTDDTNVVMCFRSLKSMRNHAERYCCSIDGYTGCPIAAAINKRYEEADAV